MLYWLSAFSDVIGPLNVLRYITFRTGGSMITALVFVFLFGPSIIDHLRLRQGKGQPIRSDGPQSHLVTKKGTPTMGAGNAVNLTDGLDGLATVPVIIVALSFGFISYLVGNSFFAEYLNVHYVAGTGELAVLCGAVIGAGLGFLWFNAPPASIFMGDTGSLALGGLIGTIAVATKHEIVLAVIRGLLVLEAVCVLVKVLVFKLNAN